MNKIKIGINYGNYYNFLLKKILLTDIYNSEVIKTI